MPSYPEEARQQGLGLIEIIVRYVIDENGKVSEVKILRGHPLFDNEVKSKVLQWTFQPLIYKGEKISIRRIHKFKMSIKI